MGWLAKFFEKLLNPRSKRPPQQDSDESFERLVWLEPHENPFGVRVLDCRPIAETFLSATKNPSAIDFFQSRAAQSGEQFCGQHPEDSIRVACELVYPLEAPCAEGPVFLAEVMEEKWNVYHFHGVLYFARSWTGSLQYVATLAPAELELRVVEVEAWPGNVLGDGSMAVQQVDFLIRSHLFGQVAPHPSPPLRTKKEIAMWSFSQYGRRGLFAIIEHR